MAGYPSGLIRYQARMLVLQHLQESTSLLQNLIGTEVASNKKFQFLITVLYSTCAGQEHHYYIILLSQITSSRAVKDKVTFLVNSISTERAHLSSLGG